MHARFNEIKVDQYRKEEGHTSDLDEEEEENQIKEKEPPETPTAIKLMRKLE